MTLSDPVGATTPADHAVPPAALKVGVVHLVRSANGIGPFKSFVESYLAHPAGMAHDLLIVFKGFGSAVDADYEEVVRTVRHEREYVPDLGVDIDLYFGLAKTLEYDILCFLNSFSVIQADDWLAHLYSAVRQPQVGLVAASGSWQSIYLSYEDPAEVAAARARLPIWRRRILGWFPFLRKLKRFVHRRRVRLAFHPFPNPHIRTNGFMVWRDLAVAIRLRPIRSKYDAYAFESGRRGLTRQVQEMNRRVLVVDRRGRTYSPEDWPKSDTFWRRNQANLMISDNQTRAYDNSAGELRRYYSWLAWGPEADAEGPN